MSSGVVVLVVAVVGAVAFGLWRLLTDGRFRGTHALRVDAQPDPGEPTGADEPATSVLAGTAYDAELGQRATLLQFSSAFCAPCRATRRVLEEVAGRTDGVAHVELDAEHHLDLVRRTGVLRTPTTLVLDHRGAEVGRAVGAPSRQQVEQVLAALR